MNVIRRLRAALHGAMSSFEPLAEDSGEGLPPAPAHLPVEGPLSSQAPGPKPGSAQLTRLPERPEFRSPCARAYSKVLIGSELPDPSAQAPARHTAGRAGWCWLLALQRPHVGGLGALRPRGHVELDGLALIK